MEDSGSIQILLTACCIIFTLILFFFYFTKRINEITFILVAYAIQTYYIPYLGLTINPFFFISFYFAFIEINNIAINKTKISINTLLIILLPITSSVINTLLIIFGYPVFESTTPPFYTIIYNALYYYLKYLFPIIFISVRFYKQALHFKLEELYKVIKLVAILSCYIAVFQIIINKITTNELILRFFGIRQDYVGFATSEFKTEGVRVSALFQEPKVFSAFIASALPLFFRDKKEYFNILLIVVTGILSVSQTFIVGIITIVFVFILFKGIKSIRKTILTTLASFIFVFYSISTIIPVLFNFYVSNSNNYLVNLLFSRAIERYDVNNIDELNDTGGIPLQKDMELPVFKFYQDKEWQYLIGHGLKNTGQIPNSYYPSYTKREQGTLAYGMNLRWYFFIIEFGLIIFVIIFYKLTKKINHKNSIAFDTKYYSFLWIFMFFIDLEILVLIIYSFHRGLAFKDAKLIDRC